MIHASIPPTVNGRQPTQAAIDKLTADSPMTAGYRPTLPTWTFWQPDGVPILFVLRDIELMLTHPVVHQGLEYYKSGVAAAEFDVKCNNSEAGNFIQQQCERFWDKGVPGIQNGYEYGWLGGENVYSTDEGPMKWDSLLDFAPRDTFAITQQSKLVGVRVKNITDRGNGQVDMWCNADGLPSKGLWYPHRPRYGAFYGRSHLMAPWRPWKRLAWKDGLESAIDGALYRYAYSGAWVRYPPDDFIAPAGSQATTADSQGTQRKYARDEARQMAEQLRAGGGGGLPSERDENGNYKWEVEWPDHVLNVDSLINAAKYLADMIYFGIGTPPELIQASETGSGYSGRAIPMEAFMMQQQRIADAMLDIFVCQVLRPLVLWNFGPSVKFEVKVKNLLQAKTKQRQGGTAETNPATQQMPGQQMNPAGRFGGVMPAQGVPTIPMSMLSLTATEREKEIVRQIVRRAA